MALGYNWTLLSESGGTLNGNTCNIRTYAKLNSQSIETNTSSVTYESRLYYGGGYFYTGSPSSKSISATGAGSQSSDANGTYNGGETTLQSITGTVTHNEQGNANVSVTGSVSFGPWGYSNSTTGAIDLPQIKRLVTVSSAPNFTDEDNNIEVKFNNPANFEALPYINFCTKNGTRLGRIERDKAKYTSPYTWVFTQEEIETIRNLYPDSNGGIVNIGFDTYSGSTKLGYNRVDRNFSIINANPTFNDFDYNDINTTTLALTGNSKYNINGYSTIRVSISASNKATAIKGATMSKYQFMIGNTTREVAYSDSDTVYIDIPNASVGEYKVYAVDSRGNSTLVTKLATQNIEYEPLYLDRANCYVERSDGGIGEDVTLTYSGTIWNNSFGQINNSITLSKYEFKKTSESQWITGTTNITPTILDNGISFSGLIRSNETGYIFPVQENYNFRLTLEDKLSTTTIELTPLPSGTPNISLNKNGVGIMCDYDETLGGLLQVGGQIISSNGGTILWSNPNPTSSFGNVTITLSSDDYDMLEIYYYDYTGTARVMSERLYKGHNSNLTALFLFNGNFYMGARAVEYTSDTQYLFGNARKIIDSGTVVSGVPTANEWLVPQYVIGYKTGLNL
jgi:hypothetical protein